MGFLGMFRVFDYGRGAVIGKAVYDDESMKTIFEDDVLAEGTVCRVLNL